MALSNMIKEPQREITETLVGFLIAAPFVYVDVLFAQWFVVSIPALAEVENAVVQVMCLLLGMAAGAAVIAIFFGVLAIIHDIGESLCTALEGRGVQMRPRERR